jgi:hypothetical protein
MSFPKLLRAFGAAFTLLLVTGCGQTPSGQSLAHTTATASRSTSASGHYATAKDAAIAAMMIDKPGSTYREDGLCPSGQACLSKAQVVGNTDPSSGFNAAYVQMGYGGSGGGAACITYLFYDAGGWHLYPPIVCGQQGGTSPILGYQDLVQVTGGGCGNVRQQPSLSSKVVACLKNGTTVTIDTTPPRYVDSHIWWSVNHGQGFMAHDVLVP